MIEKIIQTLREVVGALRGETHNTPLHEATDLATAQRLVARGAAVNARGWMGATPLHKAAEKGLADLTRFLLESGARVNATRDRGDVPLHWAATREVARVLIEHGGNSDARDFAGRAPLHWAAQFGHPKVAATLLEAGADVDAVTSDGETPLHWAAQEGHLEVIEVLLTWGTGVDTQDRWGETPLHKAIGRGQEKVARLLLTRGADASRRSISGETPGHLAQRTGRIEFASELAQREGVVVETDHPLDEGVPLARIRIAPTTSEAILIGQNAVLLRWLLRPVPKVVCAVQTPHAGISDVLILPDANGLISVTWAGDLEVRDWTTLHVRERLPWSSRVESAALSPGGQWIAVAGEMEISLLDRMANVRATVDGGERTGALAFSPTGCLLAGACSFQGGGYVRIDSVGEAGTLTPLHEVDRSDYQTPAHEFVDTLVALTFGPDDSMLLLFETSAIEHDRRPTGWRGNVVALSTTTGTVRWKTSIDARWTGDQRPLSMVQGGMGFFTELTWSRDRIYVGTTNGGVLVLDPATGAISHRIGLETKQAIVSLAGDAQETVWVVVDERVVELIH